ncbi:hypothetical protein QUF90_24665 [Desulfococcaceae bacterium HSG9]|nr:hypothetical protein [Desulfococcaceae bacterium HSG9]
MISDKQLVLAPCAVYLFIQHGGFGRCHVGDDAADISPRVGDCRFDDDAAGFIPSCRPDNKMNGKERLFHHATHKFRQRGR